MPPSPRWGDVRRFCQLQGYRETVTDHHRYLKVLPDRSTSGTMVSLGADGETIPPGLWSLVWRRQLRLADEAEFWKGLDGTPVRYAIPPEPEPAQPLPAYLVRFLADRLHWSPEQIAATTRERAQELLNAFYAGELRDP